MIQFILNMKPASVRGQYVKGIAIKGTMTPAVRVQAA